MQIQEELQKRYNGLTNQGYEVMAIMLCGSQNYGLATSNSDIDTKAIIIPSLEDLIKENKVSKTIRFENGQSDVKDIRLMYENYRKQNSNYIETLFTNYYIVNPAYIEEFGFLRTNKEAIARLDEGRAVNCFRGQIHNYYKRLFNDSSSTHDDFVKYGYSRKSFCHIHRTYMMMNDYIKNEKLYEKILKFENGKRDFLLKLKTIPENKEKVKKSAEEILTVADEIANNFVGEKSSFVLDATELLMKKYKGK